MSQALRASLLAFARWAHNITKLDGRQQVNGRRLGSIEFECRSQAKARQSYETNSMTRIIPGVPDETAFAPGCGATKPQNQPFE